MDYGKFRYEESQRAREARKKTAHVSVKEVKFRPKIGKGDFDTKVRHVQGFLAEGHKVKVSLQFRGREMAHPELGSKILDDVIEQILSVGKVETQARLEGRSMTMVLSPDKQAQEAMRKEAVEAEKAAAAELAAASETPAAASENEPAEAVETPAEVPEAQAEAPAEVEAEAPDTATVESGDTGDSEEPQE